MQDSRDNKLPLASYYLEVNRPDMAIRTLNGIDETALDDTQYWWILGMAFSQLERYGEASRALLNGLELNPADVRLLYILVGVYDSQGNLAAAEKAILQALNIYPESATLLSKYADMVASVGQFDKADALLEQAASIDPEDGVLLQTRYNLAVLKGNDSEARRFGDELLARAPEDPGNLAVTGTNMMSQGLIRQGYNRLRMAAGLDPSVVEANESIYHQGRALNHWLIVPLWPIYRFGPGTVWISGIVTIFGLKFIGLSLIAGILAFVWIAYVIYSWIAPRLVRRMQARRFR